MRWPAPRAPADFFHISGRRRDSVSSRGRFPANSEPAQNLGVCPRQSISATAGSSEERMKPLRWSVLAVIAGLACFLASPGSTSAALSHRASSTAVLSAQHGTRAAARTASHSQRGSRQSPVRPAVPVRPVNRAKTRHAGAGSRLRWHSLYGMVPYAANIRPDNNPGILDLGLNDGRSARLNRMLESRGPPRAGPPENPALRASLPPIPAHLSSSELNPSTSPNQGFTQTQGLTPIRSVGLALACRFEGTAARFVTPSPGGIPT
jgi:hypothetical protein